MAKSDKREVVQLLNEIKNTINRLDEDELKTILLQFLLRMKTVEENKGYSEHQFFIDIKNPYNDLLECKKSSKCRTFTI